MKIKTVEPRIDVTEEEMKAFFEENKEDFAQEEQVKARHILVATEKEAQEIKDKLAKGRTSPPWLRNTRSMIPPKTTAVSLASSTAVT